MKNIKTTAALTLALILPLSSLSSSAQAAGFPVMDVVGIAQMVTDGIDRAREFKSNIEEARNRMKEMKNQGSHYKNMVEGHYNFKDIINDPSIAAFMIRDDWRDILQGGDINDLRDEFDMHTDNPELQAHYDNLLRQQQIQDNMYQTSVQRNSNMQSLLSEFNSATTPAAKTDIANSLRFEQVQMQNDTQMLLAMDSLMEKQRGLKLDAKMREQTRRLWDEGIPAPALPPYIK